LSASARKVPEGVVIADGAVMMAPFATARLTTIAEPIPPRPGPLGVDPPAW
jgi:hypothetical protein